MIILNETQANTVRGESVSGYALDPIPLGDKETWALPQRVLRDSNHSIHHALLETLPTRDVLDYEYADKGYSIQVDTSTDLSTDICRIVVNNDNWTIYNNSDEIISEFSYSVSVPMDIRVEVDGDMIRFREGSTLLTGWINAKTI